MTARWVEAERDKDYMLGIISQNTCGLLSVAEALLSVSGPDDGTAAPLPDAAPEVESAKVDRAGSGLYGLARRNRLPIYGYGYVERGDQ